MGMQASLIYRMRYMRTLEAQSTGEDTILRMQGLSYLHYTAERGCFYREAAAEVAAFCHVCVLNNNEKSAKIEIPWKTCKALLIIGR